MDTIRMVDLQSQYQKIKNEIDTSIQQVIENTTFISGSDVTDFSRNLETYLNVKHVIPCGNGTDALQIAMMALGLKPGDEVITSNFTFIATVEVIGLLGLTPVIVDVDPGTFNIDVEGIRRAITPKTKAIVPVHLFGQCADMEEIMNIARENHLFVIEDTAQAISADYIFSDGTKKKAGTIGDIGCTSFFPSKNLGCFGDGGAIYTNEDELAEKLRSIVNHGMKVRYYHDNIGVNSRLDTIQAAVLNVKLKYLDGYTAARQAAAAFYDEAFQNCAALQTPVRSKNSTHIFHQYTLVTKGIDRTALQKFLQENGIPAMIYYPVPLSLQRAFIHLGYTEGDFPVTEHLCKTVISLPMHTELTEEQQSFIARKVLEFVNQK